MIRELQTLFEIAVVNFSVVITPSVNDAIGLGVEINFAVLLVKMNMNKARLPIWNYSGWKVFDLFF